MYFFSKIGWALLGMLLFGNGFSQIRIVPHVANPDGVFETRIVLTNTGQTVSDYKLIAYDATGGETASTRGMLVRGRTLDQSIEALFQTDQVSHFVIEAEETLSVLVTYRARSGGSPAQVRAQDVQATRWRFFPGDWQRVFDGLALVNTGDEPTDIVLRQYDGQGVAVAEKSLFALLGPNVKGIYLLNEAGLTPGNDHYFQIEADSPLAFMGLRFNRPASDFLWENPGIPLPPAPQPPSNSRREVTILYTNDEHGWMESNGQGGGAPALVGLWREREGYRENGPFLILSGGDMWTGPAVSTLTKGESMADVMNAMHYHAAAVGNHEFDFGTDTLLERLAQSEFPFLSANILFKDNGRRPDFALPYAIFEVNGVNIGVIGLTTVRTPEISFRAHTGAYHFADYAESLSEIVPVARRHGADMVVVIAHTCVLNLLSLGPLAQSLDIPLVMGGHCHHRRIEFANGIPFLEAGSFLNTYGTARFTFDLESEKVLNLTTTIENNIDGPGDALVQERVDLWKERTDAELGEVIGYAETDIARTPELANLIADSWLWAFPEADIAMLNRGGIRQGIPAGEITLGTILAVLPFENFLVEIQLTGDQIIENIECCSPLLGGLSSIDGYFLPNGQPLQRGQTYRVLVTDFLYENLLFATQDPTPVETRVNWRQPLIDRLRSWGTTPDNPLNSFLDATPRTQRGQQPSTVGPILQ